MSVKNKKKRTTKVKTLERSMGTVEKKQIIRENVCLINSNKKKTKKIYK